MTQGAEEFHGRGHVQWEGGCDTGRKRNFMVGGVKVTM